MMRCTRVDFQMLMAGKEGRGRGGREGGRIKDKDKGGREGTERGSRESGGIEGGRRGRRGKGRG
jgi:hypothetical protein